MGVTHWLRNIRIGMRLVLGFFVVFILASLAAGVAAWGLGSVGATIDRLVSQETERIVIAGELEKEIATNLVGSHAVLMFTDAIVAKRIQEDLDANSKRIAEIRKRIEADTPDGEARGLLGDMTAAGAKYDEKVAELMRRKDYGEDMNTLIRSELVPRANAYSGAVRSFVGLQRNHLEASRKEAIDTVSRTRRAVVILLVAGLIAAFIAAAMLSRSIVGPVRAARERTQRIATGDLNSEFQVQGRDEITDLFASLSTMQDGLRDIAKELREAGDHVLQGSSDVAAGSTDLSSRTEEQSSTLEETAASLEELAATVKQSADNAREANDQASSVSRVAANAGALVEQVVRSMTEIQSSARQIAAITSVVDNIAFQTNILALNAAVEAARAGEQGRGFAVVASEVRALAQRSATAAKEIQSLVGGSNERIDGGTRLANQAGATMAEVVASVRGVTESIAHIARAAGEQNAGIAQVSQAMSNLEQVTQTNASLVAQSAAAAEGLKQEAERLQRSAAYFRLAEETVPAKETSSHPAPPPPQAPPPTPVRAEAAAPRLAARVGNDEWEEF